MVTYTNGNIPLSMLVEFGSGWNKIDGDWRWLLPRATYQKHLNLVELARRRTGKHLTITDGWGAYRPREAQVTVRAYFASIGQALVAAYPGTSSHGGLWEGKQTAAMDYSWGDVYGWDRDAWYEDVRAAGLEPGLIHPSRNSTYPDEPWHVIDLDPWGVVPASIIPNSTQTEDEDMKLIRWDATGAIYLISRGAISYVKTLQQYQDLAATYGAYKNLSNESLTTHLIHNAIPWAAVDACMKGAAYKEDGSAGGHFWARDMAEGIAGRLNDAGLAKSIEELTATARNIEKLAA